MIRSFRFFISPGNRNMVWDTLPCILSNSMGCKCAKKTLFDLSQKPIGLRLKKKETISINFSLSHHHPLLFLTLKIEMRDIDENTVVIFGTYTLFLD